MSTIKLFLNTIKTTITNVGALLIFAIIYAILLATFFRFIWIREATLWQVLFTYAFMILIPAEFFIFQAAIIDRVRDQKFRWRAIMIDAVKFFVATIPILLLGWLLYYLLNKIALRFPAPAVPLLPVTQGPPKTQPLHWPSLLFATFRFVLLGVALPLAAIHVWIAIAGGELRSLFAGGAKAFLKRIGSAVARAFASESVLIYALGLIIFFVLPYFVLVPTFNIKGNKTEFLVFVLRLVLAYLFSFFGWVVTVGALTKSGTETAPAMSVAIAQPAEAEAAA
ncbi:MAG: hypothetical protein DMF72_07665 [Acidobacteria bacterium]|nr:MAG: hypothetical protein DMF72_07665 [Acidobacteriota bacterium]